MTEPGSRRPIEQQLADALADTARRNVPTDRPVPSLRSQDETKPRWIPPLLAAAAVITVAVGSVVAVNSSTTADHTTPAVSRSATSSPRWASSAPSSATSSNEASPSTSRRSASHSAGTPPATSRTSSRTTPTHPRTSTSTRTVSSPGTTPTSVPAHWFGAAGVVALAHPELDCPQQQTPATSVSSTAEVPVSGESAALGVAVIACNDPTGGQSQRVEVYRYSAAGPVLVQLLSAPDDQGLIAVRGVATSPDQLVLDEVGHSAAGGQGTADLPFRQTFVWSAIGGQFTGGAVVDTLAPCTADQLDVTTSAVSSQTGDAVGLLVSFANTAGTACILSGYPTADAVDATGTSLATAVPTPTGALGGMASATAALPSIDLVAGQAASAVVEWTKGSGDPACVQADHFVITPPGTTATQDADTDVGTVCAPTVHPVVPGATGRA